MALRLRSFRGRLLVISLVLIGALLAATVYTEGLVDDATRHNEQRIQHLRALSSRLADLKGSLYEVEVGLYQYAVLLDDSRRNNVELQLDASIRHVDELHRLSSGGPEGQAVGALTERLRKTLEVLAWDSRHLLDVIADVDSRFPASPLFTEHTYPANVRFITAVETALAESDSLTPSSGQREITDLLRELRYQWAQQISIVRVYIANRSGVFGMPEAGMYQHLLNRANYLQKIDAIMGELERYDERDELGLLQSDALREMNEARSEFETYFEKVIDIYQSGKWRGDIPLLRNRIQPLFGELWKLLNEAESRLAMDSTEGVVQALGTADTLSGFLWTITAFAAFLFIAGVLAYEVAIRRPMYRVIDGLEAVGKGRSYIPVLSTRTKETERLVNAFSNMRQAVYTREMRLAAILDNASEGIITINEEGTIEKFNNAAESLFGYSSAEVVGRNVSLLMPHPARDEHDRYVQRYMETGEARVIGSEINVNAQRKDGSVFPVAIKLSDMVLDGHHYFTAIVSDISERKAMLDHLRHLAEHDSLTGLYNRQYFTEELERVVQRSLRQDGMDIALLYVDLDNFKYVNDTLGHLAGDRVLIEIASLLTKRTRKSDIIARLGGDEFAVLLYDVDRETAFTAAEAYRQQVLEYQFRYEGKVIDIGCSIGLAMLAADVESKEDLMARADISCHMAKRGGRNNVHVYEKDDRVSMDTMFAHMSWARTIKEAIENDRFVFAVQPIVDIKSRRAASFEALLRMRDVEGGIIMPAGFMPSAERFGLVLDIDRWVVANCLSGFHQLMAGRDDAHLSINLSAMAIGDGEILRLVTEGLESNDVDPERLCFEITETIAIADLGAAAEFMERLRACGCKTALDDFGVGYCSFAYLKDLPVDYVKIDGSFVKDIGEDALQLAMVKSMNEIAHAMGKKTVAEFVESDRVMDMLRAIGVDYVQGFHTGRPELIDICPAAGRTGT